MKKVGRSTRSGGERQKERWQRPRKRHMTSCMRSWIQKKGKRIYTDWQDRGTELEGCAAGSGDKGRKWECADERVKTFTHTEHLKVFTPVCIF